MRTNRKLGISRRAVISAGTTAVLAPAVQAQAPADLAKTIREAQQRNSETMAKVDMPSATEPAFQFKA